MSPLQRTLRWIREQGYYAEKVEHWNPFAKRRIDLLGVGDILATDGKENLIIQATTKQHVKERVLKAAGSDALRLWLDAGGKFCVVGWASYKHHRKTVWIETVAPLQ